MHELSIAQAIVDSAREEASRRGGGRVRRVGVRVGDISGVAADALEFCFGMTVQGTDMEDADLDVERVKVRFRCRACQHEFEPVEFDPTCPACRAETTSMTAGDELALSYLELEQVP